MASSALEIASSIVAAKSRLRASFDVTSVFAEVEHELGREVADIAARVADGEQILPDIAFSDITAGTVGQDMCDLVRRRGCAIVRNVFAREHAQQWNAQLSEYLERNTYLEKAREKAGLDKYFDALNSGKPQIYGIYWSPPQIAARQSENLTTARLWLNGLWHSRRGPGVDFDPDHLCSYADRIRRREPGDTSLGLSPHIDGGSVERWIDPGFGRVYGDVFSKNWHDYDPFDAAYRPDVKEIPSPAVCRMFRTYQGWTALTEQGAGDGTLQLLPIPRAMVYLLLRPLLDDVPDDSLCDAAPGRALGLSRHWHAALMPALVSIPTLYAGDTIWWHPDLIHAVDNEHRGANYSNVMYIGSAPACAKNRAFLELQKAAFESGKSCPDFAPEDYETDFTGRATVADLTPLGRQQMGFFD
jgi:hypothetical protein